MSTNNLLAVVAERLVPSIRDDDSVTLKNELDGAERRHDFSKSKIVNFPIARHNNRTLVHIAAHHGRKECLLMLLKNGGNPNALSSRTDLSQTPLHLASHEGYRICIEVLLNYGANMGIRNSHSRSPQDLAARKPKCEAVFLHEIAKHRIPDRTEAEKLRVLSLHELVSDDDRKFMKQYSELPPHHRDLATRYTDFHNQTLLYRAANEEQLKVVRFILSKSSNQPLHNLYDNRTPLIASCQNNNYEISNLLLERSPGLIFISEKHANQTPLHIACSLGLLDLVKIILKALKSCMHLYNHFEKSRDFLDCSDIKGQTSLYCACKVGSFEIVQELIEFHKENSGSVTLSINASLNDSKRTPLHAAIQNENMDIVQLLMSMKSINIHQKGKLSKESIAKLLSLHGESAVLEPAHPASKSTAPKHSDTQVEMRENRVQRVRSKTVADKTITPTVEKGMGVFKKFQSGKLVALPKQEWPSFKYNDLVSKETIAKLLSLHGESGAAPVLEPDHPASISTASKHSDTEVEMRENRVKRVRSKTVADKTLKPTAEKGMGVFEKIQSGKLVVLSKQEGQSFKYNDLEQVLVAPLAEAAACSNLKILTLLLNQGARDEKGLACRILYFINQMNMVHNILAHHVTRNSHPSSWKSSTHSVYLELNWSKMKLPECLAEWFKQDTKLHLKNDEENVASSLAFDNQEIHNSLSVDNNYQMISLTAMSSINFVCLCDNQLVSVPVELFQLPNVQVLDISHNKMVELPDPSASSLETTGTFDSWHCPSLKELNVSDNCISILPKSLWELQSLCFLDCSSNNIEKLFDDTMALCGSKSAHSLENINLSKNQLNGEIGEFLFELPSLKQLDLSCNKITSLPTALWKNSVLNDLSISSNKIKTLPMCEEEDKFQELYKQRRNTAPFRPGLNKMSSASSSSTTQRLTNDPDLTTDFSMKIQPLKKKESLSSIAVSHSYTYSSLSKLNVSGNSISFFPQGLSCLAPNLKVLDISNNKELKEIDIMYVPSKLEILTASECGITQIGNLAFKNERVMTLRNCRYGEVSGQECSHRSHTHLSKLTKLIVSDNKLTTISLVKYSPPIDFDEAAKQARRESAYISGNVDLIYPSLKVLYMSENCLSSFNPNIGHMKKLKQVDLSKNSELEAIPMEFGYLLKKLNELNIKDTPKLGHIEEYKDAPLNHLLGYMRSCLKALEYYRTIKLFFVGNGERGKSTLLKRLQGFSEDKNVDRTVGIDIEPWIFPDPNKGDRRNPVKFLAWDFAGQDIYHTTHQCFYSKRSLYLALFKLDVESGIEELHQWLRCINLRAPGSPVIIVGTHLDCVHDQGKLIKLEEEIQKRYCNQPNYPKVLDVVFLSSLKKKFNISFNRRFSTVKELRNKIYDVASHLALLEGSKLVHMPKMQEDSPKAILQQKVPCAFINLQEQIEEKSREMNLKRIPPVMEEEDFRNAFLRFVEDEEELAEAVYFLKLQGSLLHFEDYNLRQIYFLDPQWLPKMMADVIQPTIRGKESVLELKDLFCHRNYTSFMKTHFVNYMEKFEVIMRINPEQVIVPCGVEKSRVSVPDEVQVNMNTKTFTDVDGDCYPPLTRFWLSDFIPDGFWPRLICGIFKDPQIQKIKNAQVLKICDQLQENRPFAKNRRKVMRMVIGSCDTGTSSYTVKSSRNLIILTDNFNEDVQVTFWKTGFSFAFRNRVLFYMMQDDVTVEDEVETLFVNKATLLKYKFRIELHVFANEFLSMCNLAASSVSGYTSRDGKSISGLATKLLLLLMDHMKKLAEDFFAGMIVYPGTVFCSYMICWKCMSSGVSYNNLRGKFIIKDNKPHSVYVVEDHISLDPKQQFVECCFHGKIPFKEQAPELIFWDLANERAYNGNSELEIHEDKVLGRGTFGVVFEGELFIKSQTNVQVQRGREVVAVKMFMNGGIARLQNTPISPDQLLNAYQEIRQEVSFISNLSHPNLTKLCGVRINPYLCLVLEMAPNKSLEHVLKDYHDLEEVLEPKTIKEAALQIALGLEYLHANQRVHLDMKSSNVLVWKFPSPRDSRSERLKQSRNVLLKITDYGISQVSIGLIINPMFGGTPGYMAPEILGSSRNMVSSEKIDVFAYGMVLFQLLSQSPPFQNAIDPNFEVQHDIRPTIDDKNIQSPILIQELICACWHHNPDNRPKMKEVTMFIQDAEFESLRDEVSLVNIQSVSTVECCRICPEYYEHSLKSNESANHTKLLYNTMVPLEKHMERDLDDIGALQISLTEGSLTNDKEVSINQEVSNKMRSRQSLCRNRYPINKRTESKELTQFHASSHDFESCSQIWLHSHTGKNQNIVNILTFIDNHPGLKSHFIGDFSSTEVTSLCAVKNTMWMGTTSGEIMVFNARTLQRIFGCTLLNDKRNNGTSSAVLKIIHVEEVRSVVVLTHDDIWSFFDTVVDNCLKLQYLGSPGSPCYDFVTVSLNDHVKLYGTLNNGQLLILESNPESVWRDRVVSITLCDSPISKSRHVGLTQYTSSPGEKCKQLWMNYQIKPILIPLDVTTEKQEPSVDCTQLFTDKMSGPFQISSMKCIDNQIIIGTTIGTVGIVDARNHQVIKILRCHQSEVFHLLPLPLQLASAVCAEMPFTNQNINVAKEEKTTMQSHYRSFELDMIATVGTGRHDCVFNSHQVVAADQAGTLQSNETLLQLWKIEN